ncbi:lisH domain and HEAT repeat-containing protein KIAA1468 homolog [Temnothorax curvispinosus]|uniref:LisH domain and HEAT repeat-containing protein KIAA1468 homolog n=1 Tax=Temnothorax curvispinosus TaxID=300111 RepID=A0A6J1RI41_9HYME|nr:lisH domain and HEAT repeat-containing protein KIAA1468 homolog [Temnothorax curvispinosus]
MILTGLVVMAKLAEEPLETEDILTICWEQSQHKYTERRLLAVECCSYIPISAAVRNSLMLSMRFRSSTTGTEASQNVGKSMPTSARRCSAFLAQRSGVQAVFTE